MDFFTILIIAVFVYNLFNKKDKPPQRRSGSPTGQPALPDLGKQPQGKKKGSIFQSLEREIREAAERFERELQKVPVGPTPNAPRKVQPASQPIEVYGEEGVSDYGKYPSTQGNQGLEGMAGTEGGFAQEGQWAQVGNFGLGGSTSQEGGWGDEGRYYGEKKKDKAMGDSPNEPNSGLGRLASVGFSPSQAIQGIVWAEVLKEPKGRRGLSSLSRR